MQYPAWFGEAPWTLLQMAVRVASGDLADTESGRSALFPPQITPYS